MEKISCKKIVYPFPFWITGEELLDIIHEDLKKKGIEQEHFEIIHNDNGLGYEVVFKNTVEFNQ